MPASGITASAALQNTTVGLQPRNSPAMASGAKMSRTLKYLVIGLSPQGLSHEHPELVKGCGFARAAPFDELRVLG